MVFLIILWFKNQNIILKFRKLWAFILFENLFENLFEIGIKINFIFILYSLFFIFYFYSLFLFFIRSNFHFIHIHIQINFYLIRQNTAPKCGQTFSDEPGHMWARWWRRSSASSENRYVHSLINYQAKNRKKPTPLEWSKKMWFHITPITQMLLMSCTERQNYLFLCDTPQNSWLLGRETNSLKVSFLTAVQASATVFCLSCLVCESRLGRESICFTQFFTS